MTNDTPMPKVPRLEVISTGARRRWTLEEKRRLVAVSYGGPRLVSATARRNGLSASQLFTWRRLARDGLFVEADEATTFAAALISPSLPERLDGAEKVNALNSSLYVFIRKSSLLFQNRASGCRASVRKICCDSFVASRQ
jgi:transposase-like protein